MLFNVGVATVGVQTFTGQSVIQSTNENFPGITTVGNLVQYTDLNVSQDPVRARVVSVGSSHLEVVGVTTVTDICDGTLPQTSVKSVNDLRILTSMLDTSSDNTLYTPLPKKKCC